MEDSVKKQKFKEIDEGNRDDGLSFLIMILMCIAGDPSKWIYLSTFEMFIQLLYGWLWWNHDSWIGRHGMPVSFQ